MNGKCKSGPLLRAPTIGLFNRKTREISPLRAAVWSGVWVLLSAAFGVGIALTHGQRPGLEFAAGYVLEKALAVDNLFVIALLFAHFQVPARHQHRVLYWGILGALVTRGLFVGLGTALLSRFDWVLYVFGGLLVVAGVHVAVQQQELAAEEGLICFSTPFDASAVALLESLDVPAHKVAARRMYSA